MPRQKATFPIPNLHIVGFQKCGTSALAHFLSQHPDICMVEGKEAHVFDDPAFPKTSGYEDFVENRYASKLRHFNEEAYILDATPITIFHPTFIKRCVESNPEAKFLVIKRDPVERAFSHYKMTKQRSLEKYDAFRAFLCEFWRMRGIESTLPECDFQHSYRDHSYLLRGRYKKQLNYLYTLVSPEQVMIIEQSDLNQSHDETLAEIFAFLDLTNHEIKKEKVFVSDNKQSKDRFARLYASLYFSVFK